MAEPSTNALALLALLHSHGAGDLAHEPVTEGLLEFQLEELRR